MNFKILFKKIFSNKIFIYLGSRYVTYGLQFFVSLIIASRLGPYYMGIYGFISLLLNYVGQFNLGIPHSLNVLLVHHKGEDEAYNQYVVNSFIIYGGLSIIVVAIYATLKLFNIELNDKYPIDNYLLLIVLTAVLTYYNYVMATVLRFKNKVNQLSIVQSLNVALNLAVVFFFIEENLVMALVVCQFVSYIVSIIITYKTRILPPLRSIKMQRGVLKELLHKGIYLFLYNSCFFFILLSVRTVISVNYSVEEFGLFTFSFTIAHAVLLLMESLMMIIFPKVIYLLSSKDYAQIKATISKIRVAFISSSHFAIYLALSLFPLLLLFLPKYADSVTALNLTALAILMNTNSYGYSSFLIAQNKENISARISVLSLLLNIALALILTNIFHVRFSYVIIATLITYLFFSFMTVSEGNKLVGDKSIIESIVGFFPIRLLVPYVIALVLSILEQEYLIWIPLVVYVVINYKDIVVLIQMARKLANNPNIADI